MKLPHEYRADEEARCQAKMPYLSREEAAAAASYMQYRHGGNQTKPYHCRTCGRWHLASA